MLNITRRILNVVLSLHRTNILRSIDASQGRARAGFYRAEQAQRVADIEQERAEKLSEQAYDIEDDEVVVELELRSELKKLPEVYPS